MGGSATGGVGGLSLSGSHSMGGQCVRASDLVDWEEPVMADADTLSLCCLLWACFCSSTSAAVAVRSFLWLRTRDNIRPPELGMVRCIVGGGDAF